MSILRMRFSCMARRLCELVNSSLMSTPFSSCSSVPTTWTYPGVLGRARGEIPVSVISKRLYSPLTGGSSLIGWGSIASRMTPSVEPQPISVTWAFGGPNSFGGFSEERTPSILRMRFSCMAWRLWGLVNSSLMSTPFSSCSSVATTCTYPGVPGRARGDQFHYLQGPKSFSRRPRRDAA